MTTLGSAFPLNKDSARRRLLVYFFTHPGAKHYLRELAVLLEADPANLSRDLARLEAEGMFRSEMRGRQKYFSLNTAHPLHEAFKTIVLKPASVKSVRRPKKQKRPLYRIAEASLKKAVAQAIRDHARTGDKVVIYRRGKVVEISAAKLLRLKKSK